MLLIALSEVLSGSTPLALLAGGVVIAVVGLTALMLLQAVRRGRLRAERLQQRRAASRRTAPEPSAWQIAGRRASASEIRPED